MSDTSVPSIPLHIPRRPSASHMTFKRRSNMKQSAARAEVQVAGSRTVSHRHRAPNAFRGPCRMRTSKEVVRNHRTPAGRPRQLVPCPRRIR